MYLRNLTLYPIQLDLMEALQKQNKSPKKRPKDLERGTTIPLYNLGVTKQLHFYYGGPCWLNLTLQCVQRKT